jgi:hypothetical protein
VGGRLGEGIESGRWEQRVLGGARWATWACRSQLGRAASLPRRWEILGGWVEWRLVWVERRLVFLLNFKIWCFCYKQFLCNFYTLAKVSFFYWVIENMCFLSRLNRSYFLYKKKKKKHIVAKF